MDRLLHALMLGVPTGVVLTAIQLVIARRNLVRRMQANPPPPGVKHRDRILAEPLKSTLGVVFPLSLLVAMCFGATLLAYVVASR
jgi:hypothetical protein